MAIACDLCTYLNNLSSFECEVCSAPLSKQINESETSEDDEDTTTESKFNQIESNIDKWSDIIDGKYVCKKDGKVCSTKSLMVCYIMKKYGDSNEGDKISNNVKERVSEIESELKPEDLFKRDRDLALKLALADFDEMHSSDQMNTNYVTQFESSSSDNDEENNAPSMSISNIFKSVKKQKQLTKKRSTPTKYFQPLKRKKPPQMENLVLPEISNIEDNTVTKSLKLNALLNKADSLSTCIQQVMKKSKTSCVENLNEVSKNLMETLRDYQRRGVEWLLALYRSQLNGILGDEMGLGKTLQVIAFLLQLHQDASTENHPHLIVMPLSVISSWKNDLIKFVPNTKIWTATELVELSQNDNLGAVNVYVHHGDRSTREEAFRKWSRMIRKAMIDDMEYGVKRTLCMVITTYEMAIKDVQLLSIWNRGNIGWHYLVVDEAHRLKNRSSSLFSFLNKLKVSRRLLLTGTPLQNNLEELWSLMTFLLPGLFGNIHQFTDWFNQPFEATDDDEHTKNPLLQLQKFTTQKPTKTNQAFGSGQNKLSNISDLLSNDDTDIIISSLHRIIKPFLLRRVKADVMEDLPPKYERILLCPLTEMQIKLYQMFRDSTTTATQSIPTIGSFEIQPNQYDEGSTSSSSSSQQSNQQQNKKLMNCAVKPITNFNNLVMQLRKLCNHPYLILEDFHSIPDEIYYEYLIATSGKLLVLDQLLKYLLHGDSKILIFSQMTTMLTIIEGYIFERFGLQCFRLDGKTSHEDRQMHLKLFNNHSTPDGIPKTSSEDTKIFLLSTRAGGVGINLQSADTVIIFDSDWNPQQDLQAISRAHRMGQRKPVLVLRLISHGVDEITNNSIEQKILKRATQKLKASQQILSNGTFGMDTLEDTSTMNMKGIHEIKQIFEDNDENIETEIMKKDPAAHSVVIPEMILINKTNDGTVKETEWFIIYQSCRRQIDPLSIKTMSELHNNIQNNSEFISFNRIKPFSFNTSKGRTDWKFWFPEFCSSEVLDVNQSKGQTPRNKKYYHNLNENWLWDKNESKFEKESIKFETKKKLKEKKTKKARIQRQKVDKNNTIDEEEIIYGDQSDDMNSDLNDFSDEDVAEEDICQTCYNTWVPEDLMENYLKINQLKNDEDEWVNVDDLNDHKMENATILQLETLMIICDICDGSFHMICAGLDQVPADEWYCNYCKRNTGIA